MYIYGDSHAMLLFHDCKLDHTNFFQYAITMHRIGRDSSIYNFKQEHNNSDRVFCIVYGEVDVRCHIGVQREKGREVDDICKELVTSYFKTIHTNITSYKQIIIIAIPPPVEKEDHTHGDHVPFIGTNAERVDYTNRMNRLIEELCKEYSYTYFNPFDLYKRENGCLKYELSDNCLHIGKNDHFLTELDKVIL